MIGIYKITNPKGRIYIGQSVNISDRLRMYKTHHCAGQGKLYNSILKYGWERHLFEVIEKCKKTELNDKEIYWSNVFNSVDYRLGLNIRHCGGSKGKLNKHTRKKISEKLKGHAVSEQTRYKIRTKLIGNTPWNKNTKGLQVAWNKNIPLSWKQKQLLSALYLGKVGKDASSAKKIIQYDLNGNKIKDWFGAREINKYLGYSWSCINRCCRGERRSSYGYIWKYE